MGIPRTNLNAAKHALFALSLFVLGAPAAWAACSPAAVCGDTSASFSGHVIFDDVVLSWETDSEDSDVVSYYMLRRYDCASPGSCTVDVALIPADGSCDQLAAYVYTDTPPDPVSSWTYTLETWRSDNTRACAVDAVPQ